MVSLLSALAMAFILVSIWREHTDKIWGAIKTKYTTKWARQPWREDNLAIYPPIIKRHIASVRIPYSDLIVLGSKRMHLKKRLIVEVKGLGVRRAFSAKESTRRILKERIESSPLDKQNRS